MPRRCATCTKEEVAEINRRQIAVRLDQRFRLLTGGNRTSARAASRRSRRPSTGANQLLSEPERSLVRRVAVFAGGWSLEAAEAVNADAVRPEAPQEHAEVFELLRRLVAKSMVVVVVVVVVAEEPFKNEPSVVRYRFLEIIREYAEASTSRLRRPTSGAHRTGAGI